MAWVRTPSPSSVIAVLSAVVIAVVTGGYTLYWFHLADGVLTGVDAWAAEQRDRGYVVAFRDLTVTGFPGRLRVRAAAPALGRASGALPWHWAGPTLVAELAPWDPRRATIRLPGAHRLDTVLDGRPRTVRADAASAVIEVLIDGRGRVRDAALKASDLSAAVVETGQAVSIAGLEIVVHRRWPAEMLGGDMRRDLDVGFAVEDLILPAQPNIPLGRRIHRLAGEAGARGPLPLDGTAAAAAAWREDGGRLDIRHLTLDWGRLQIVANGRLSLDERLQPRVDLDGRLRGWSALFDALVSMRQMGRTEATLASLALSALARPAADGGPPVLPAKISLRDRRLYLGPVPLLKLAPVVWR
ncbi:MAG: DUF2125 domain-containing protein [Kiloniellales bacterium]